MLHRKVHFENFKDFKHDEKQILGFTNLDYSFILPHDSNSSNKNKENKLKISKQKNFLEPIKLKIKNIHQERIVSVFDQLIQRISIVAALPSIIKSFEEFHLLVGAQLVIRIQKYTELKTEYDTRAKKLEEIINLNTQQLPATKINTDNPAVCNDEENLIPDCLKILPDLQVVAPKFSSQFQKSIFSLKTSFDDKEDKEISNKNENSSSHLEVETKKPSAEEDAKENAEPVTVYSGQLNLAEMEKLMWKQDSIQRKMKCMVPQIQKSVRSIIQGFNKNSSATNAVIHHCKIWFIERSQGSTEILNELEKLKKVVIDGLLTLQEDQREKDEHLENLKAREKDYREKITNLESILSEVHDKRQKAVGEKNRYILELQQEYHNLEKSLTKCLHETNGHAKEKKNTMMDKHTNKKDELRNGLQTLKKDFQKQLDINRQSEYKLRSRKWKFENELEAIIQKYDNGIGDKNTEFESIEEEYKLEKIQLEKLEESFKIMEVDYKQVMEERYQEELKEKRRLEEERMLLESAVTIQAFYRSFKARRDLKRQRKKN